MANDDSRDDGDSTSADTVRSPRPAPSRPTFVGALAPGDRLGRYRIEELLGRGGMGAVFRARDEQIGRPVALKVLQALDDPDLRARFARELRAMAALRHPGIGAVLDAGQDRGIPFIVMELVAGPSLSAAIKESRPGSPRPSVHPHGAWGARSLNRFASA